MSEINTQLVEKIKQLKQEKNAVILVHSYQNIELDEIADYVGDSLHLSQMAAKTNADIIVFAGVYFMAETAKILSPNKKVLLPRLESGCKMADMIDVEQLREFKNQNPNIPVVCYVNSSAAVKAEVDICCTSANAQKVVAALNAKKILFVPDTYLGSYVRSQLKNVEIITYPGFCPTHMMIREDDITNLKKQYPNALVLVHPECHGKIVELADYVGSTTGIISYAQKSNAKEFIIATEKAIVDRLERDYSDKKFILASNKAICPNMKWHRLEDIYNALANEEYEIEVNPDVAKKALKPIEKMVAIN